MSKRPFVMDCLDVSPRSSQECEGQDAPYPPTKKSKLDTESIQIDVELDNIPVPPTPPRICEKLWDIKPINPTPTSELKSQSASVTNQLQSVSTEEKSDPSQLLDAVQDKTGSKVKSSSVSELKTCLKPSSWAANYLTSIGAYQKPIKINLSSSRKPKTPEETPTDRSDETPSFTSTTQNQTRIGKAMPADIRASNSHDVGNDNESILKRISSPHSPKNNHPDALKNHHETPIMWNINKGYYPYEELYNIHTRPEEAYYYDRNSTHSMSDCRSIEDQSYFNKVEEFLARISKDNLRNIEYERMRSLSLRYLDYREIETAGTTRKSLSPFHEVEIKRPSHIEHTSRKRSKSPYTCNYDDSRESSDKYRTRSPIRYPGNKERHYKNMPSTSKQAYYCEKMYDYRSKDDHRRKERDAREIFDSADVKYYRDKLPHCIYQKQMNKDSTSVRKESNDESKNRHSERLEETSTPVRKENRDRSNSSNYEHIEKKSTRQCNENPRKKSKERSRSVSSSKSENIRHRSPKQSDKEHKVNNEKARNEKKVKASSSRSEKYAEKTKNNQISLKTKSLKDLKLMMKNVKKELIKYKKEKSIENSDKPKLTSKIQKVKKGCSPIKSNPENYKGKSEEKKELQSIPLKSVIRLKDNLKHKKSYNTEKIEEFDLRKKLVGKSLNEYFSKIHCKNQRRESIEKPRENLKITVNNSDEENKIKDTEKIQIVTQKNNEKTKTKKSKYKKIKLVIKVCESSQSSDSEEDSIDITGNKETNVSNEDLSFLDDLNIDEIVNGLICEDRATEEQRAMELQKEFPDTIVTTKNKDSYELSTKVDSVKNNLSLLVTNVPKNTTDAIVVLNKKIADYNGKSKKEDPGKGDSCVLEENLLKNSINIEVAHNENIATYDLISNEGDLDKDNQSLRMTDLPKKPTYTTVAPKENTNTYNLLNDKDDSDASTVHLEELIEIQNDMENDIEIIELDSIKKEKSFDKEENKNTTSQKRTDVSEFSDITKIKTVKKELTQNEEVFIKNIKKEIFYEDLTAENDRQLTKSDKFEDKHIIDAEGIKVEHANDELPKENVKALNKTNQQNKNWTTSACEIKEEPSDENCNILEILEDENKKNNNDIIYPDKIKERKQNAQINTPEEKHNTICSKGKREPDKVNLAEEGKNKKVKINGSENHIIANKIKEEPADESVNEDMTIHKKKNNATVANATNEQSNIVVVQNKTNKSFEECREFIPEIEIKKEKIHTVDHSTDVLKESQINGVLIDLTKELPDEDDKYYKEDNSRSKNDLIETNGVAESTEAAGSEDPDTNKIEKGHMFEDVIQLKCKDNINNIDSVDLNVLHSEQADSKNTYSFEVHINTSLDTKELQNTVLTAEINHNDSTVISKSGEFDTAKTSLNLPLQKNNIDRENDIIDLKPEKQNSNIFNDKDIVVNERTNVTEDKNLENEQNKILNSPLNNKSEVSEVKERTNVTEDKKPDNEPNQTLNSELNNKSVVEQLNNNRNLIINNEESEKSKILQKEKLPDPNWATKQSVANKAQIPAVKDTPKTSVEKEITKSCNSTIRVNTQNINTQKPESEFRSEETKTKARIEKRLLEYLQEPVTVTSVIHRGKFSKIFQCKTAEGQSYALKILRQDLIEGVVKEEMLIGLQQDIPKEKLYFVHIVDGLSIDGKWCYIMELYPKNLSQVLNENTKALHINVVQNLSKQLVNAVMVLRHKNIVHSDIKPTHIMLNSANTNLKLCGFDSAHYCGQREVLPNIGTVNYRAPEIIIGYSAGFSIDVWSIALVIFEMATGRQLFPGVHNNDILYKQMCTLEFMPLDMIKQSPFAYKHFDGARFMRKVPDRNGGNEKITIFKSQHQFYKNNILKSTIKNKYFQEWSKGIPRLQRINEIRLIDSMCELLEEMLRMHPNNRLSIEFIYARTFVFDPKV